MSPYEKDAFKYCMLCGDEFDTVSNIEKHCPGCNYRYFISASPSACGLVLNTRNEILLIKRGRDPFKGSWDMPAGFSDELETFEDTLSREMNEEINLEVKNYQYFTSIAGDYDYNGVIKRCLSACYIINVSDEEIQNIRAGDDAEEVQWFSLENFDYNLIGFPQVKQILKKLVDYLDNKN